MLAKKRQMEEGRIMRKTTLGPRKKVTRLFYAFLGAKEKIEFIFLGPRLETVLGSHQLSADSQCFSALMAH